MAAPETTTLDRALARSGQSISVRRRIGTSDEFTEVTTRGRRVSFRPDELTASIAQIDSKVILSPTPFEKAPPSWRLNDAPVYPRRGDQCVIDGRPRQIEACWPRKVRNVVVRIELHVKG